VDNYPHGIWEQQLNELDNVAYITEGADEPGTKLVGRIHDEPDSIWYRPRNFLLLDGEVLVLQDHGLKRAEIIKNKGSYCCNRKSLRYIS
jgi:hypothetical protein